MRTSNSTLKRVRSHGTKLLKIDFIRFAMVGAVGFTVTAILLKLLHGELHLNITLATLIASEGALISNFIFHQKWTYNHLDHNEKSINTKLLHFHMSSWSGVAIITTIETIAVKVFEIQYIIALVIAAFVTMFWNFFWTKYFIFNGRAPKVLLDPEDNVPLKS